MMGVCCSCLCPRHVTQCVTVLCLNKMGAWPQAIESMNEACEAAAIYCQLNVQWS